MQVAPDIPDNTDVWVTRDPQVNLVVMRQDHTL